MSDEQGQTTGDDAKVAEADGNSEKRNADTESGNPGPAETRPDDDSIREVLESIPGEPERSETIADEFEDQDHENPDHLDSHIKTGHSEEPFFDEDDEHAPSIVSELEYQKIRQSRGGEDDESESLELENVAQARAIIEGFLFSSNEPVSVQKLSKLLNNLHPRTVRGLVLELQMEYDTRPGALQIVEIANGFQISTRPHLAPWMFRLHKHRRRSALSPATLETLAIVAYRQPMTKTEIEAIRGVESGAALRTLQDLNVVEVSGRREVIGRPQLYATTEQFLKVFGLKSLADLPSIAELRAQFAEEQKLKRKTAADAETAAAEIDQAEPPPNESHETLEESDNSDLTDQSDLADQSDESDSPDSPDQNPMQQPDQDIHPTENHEQ